jgi:tetratricopeptide (TPR) repeat protein
MNVKKEPRKARPQSVAPAPATPAKSKPQPDLFILLALVGLTLVIYAQVYTFEFINFDDNLYVTDSPHTQAGLSLEGIRWAFTTGRASNWHPITWISHMVDVQLFGERPGAHHLVNVLLHATNAALLFWLLRRMTLNLWASAFVAALFAVHPLHVESVAWVAERKDVLSTLFWLLTTLAYCAYVRRGGIARYALMAALFAIGLMTKPMLVTLPATLLLLDYWPLGRVAPDRPAAPQLAKLLIEKLPLFALAIASSAATYWAQHEGQSIAAIDILPMYLRVANAAVVYLRYLLMMVWPTGLAPFYPHPGPDLPMWQVAVAALFLLPITAFAIARARRQPYLLVGWLWYLGTELPVIGLVQVGAQGHADRYTYVPLIGVFIMIAWGIPALAAKMRVPRAALAAAAGVVVAALSVTAVVQASYWHDSITLFQHTLEVTSRNHLAHKNLGVAFANQHHYKEAIEHYQKAIQLKPEDPDLYYNLGNALNEMDRTDDAIAQYEKALKVRPDHAETHYNLGNALAKKGDYEGAVAHYREVVARQPEHLGAHINMGNALALLGRPADATKEFRTALDLEPNNLEALINIGNALSEQNQLDDAVAYYRKAIPLKPNHPDTHCNLAYSLVRQQKLQEALDEFRETVRLDPTNARAQQNVKALEAQLAGKK